MQISYKQCPACLGQAESKRLPIHSQLFSICSDCKTLWLNNGSQFINYDYQYMNDRGHNSSLSVINSKKRTFKKLWGKLKYISGPILEVGCSANFSLRVALDMGLDIYGLEVNKNVIESLSGQGISVDRISVNGLRAFVNKRFEAVAFFDSFEHLPDPRGFLSELTAYLSDGAYIIIVLPNGSSISRKVLGRYWPHYVIDHWVHYTLRGMKMLLSVYNIKIINSFYPIKDVSLEMIIRHMVIHRNFPINILDKFRIVSSLRFPFNIGEMGLICRYNREARKLI